MLHSPNFGCVTSDKFLVSFPYMHAKHRIYAHDDLYRIYQTFTNPVLHHVISNVIMGQQNDCPIQQVRDQQLFVNEELGRVGKSRN